VKEEGVLLLAKALLLLLLLDEEEEVGSLTWMLPELLFGVFLLLMEIGCEELEEEEAAAEVAEEKDVFVPR